MSAGGPHERLVAALTADLTPVRRLSAPFLRALVWLAITVAIAVALAVFSDLGAMGRRLGASPDLWVAAAGSAMTAVLAVIAAFELNLPDRKPLWALLPLPAAILWVVASGIGCLRSWFVADTGPAPLADVVVEVAQESIATPADLQKKLDQLKKDGRTSALFLVSNADGELRFVALGLQ